MKRTFSEKVQSCRARITLAALLSLLAVSASHTASAQVTAQAPTWTANDAYLAYAAYTSPDPASPKYFFLGPNPFTSWTNPFGQYSIIVAHQGGTSWNQFWYEAEEIELAEDAYYWAVHNGGTPDKYADQIDQLCQGFIDKMTPETYFGQGTPWGPRHGDPFNWHGANFKDTNYAPVGDGDRFNDDLMWAAIAFARAYQITHTLGWLTAAENQVDYVWANAQAHTNASDGGTNGSVVGLLQFFCNTNDAKYGDCSTKYWNPNLDAEVNFTFVIAADLLADATAADASKSQQYKNERDAVYAWAMANLYTETSAKATACSHKSGVTCAEIYDSNNTATFNGEDNYWYLYGTSATQSSWDFSMNYGNAIQAAVRMGDNATAQKIANYLMYGLSNPNHPYAGVYQWDATHSYCILPYYGSATYTTDATNSCSGMSMSDGNYDEGGNFAGSNGIALRGVAYGLSRGALDSNTQQWAQANVQAAWNNKNTDNVIWDDWTPTHITGKFKYPSVTSDYDYNSWDCSDAVAGLLTVPHP